MAEPLPMHAHEWRVVKACPDGSTIRDCACGHREHVMPLTVRDIVAQYLRANGYDGLTSRMCCCRLDGLIPCGKYASATPGNCVPGHLGVGECIVPGPRPEPATKSTHVMTIEHEDHATIGNRLHHRASCSCGWLGKWSRDDGLAIRAEFEAHARSRPEPAKEEKPKAHVTHLPRVERSGGGSELVLRVRCICGWLGPWSACPSWAEYDAHRGATAEPAKKHWLVEVRRTWAGTRGANGWCEKFQAACVCGWVGGWYIAAEWARAEYDEHAHEPAGKEE